MSEKRLLKALDDARAVLKANVQQAKIMSSMMEDELEVDLVPQEITLLRQANQRALRKLNKLLATTQPKEKDAG